jgi:hypothetical protein
MMPVLHSLLVLLLIVGSLACNRTPDESNTEQPVQQDTVVVENEPADKFLIRDQQTGPFKIGDELPGPATMMKYQMRIEQQTRTTEEGPVTEQVTIIGENDVDLLRLKPGLLTSDPNYTNTINEITVVSEKYKTDRSIGIGSTLTEFIKAYPDADVWYTYVSGMYVLETDQVKVQFLLDESDYTGEKPEVKSEITPLELADFKQDSKIKSVRII